MSEPVGDTLPAARQKRRARDWRPNTPLRRKPQISPQRLCGFVVRASSFWRLGRGAARLAGSRKGCPVRQPVRVAASNWRWMWRFIKSTLLGGHMAVSPGANAQSTTASRANGIAFDPTKTPSNLWRYRPATTPKVFERCTALTRASRSSSCRSNWATPKN